jgi:hypothetical protein
MKASLLICIAAISASASRAGPFSMISDSEKLTAVAASAHNGYVRSRLADGTFRPETYAFGKGGILDIANLAMRDPTFDDVEFPAIAHMLAGPLARQNYLPAKDPNTTNLLLMVFWGTTTGGRLTQDGAIRDQLNYANARLLGFDTEPPFAGMTDPVSDPGYSFFGPSFRMTFLNSVHGGVMSAIEESRYYVILRAYDFQDAWKQKKLKLLWETRFSLSERHHDFGKDLPSMAQTASVYFGQDSYGLVMKPIPEGRVDIGQAKVIEDSSADEGEASGDLSGIAGDWQGKSKAFPAFVIHVDQGGASTFENPTNDWLVPAHVSVKGDTVTVKVLGWGVIFNGRIKGDHISGTLSQYGRGHSITFYRSTKQAGP